MPYHLVCHKSNTTGVIYRAGTAYPSGTTDFTTVFSGVRDTRSLVFLLTFLDLRILITSLVSLNFSYLSFMIVIRTTRFLDLLIQLCN
jgi:hypothetical protein